MITMTRAMLSLTVCLLLAGCSEDGQSDAAAFLAVCETQLEVPDEVCVCMGELAASELSSDGVRWLIAAINKDAATTKALRESMPWTDLVAASMFLVSAPSQCDSELNIELDTGA